MDRMIYVAMSGAKEAMTAQAINSHNLANVDTPGFRADLAEFRSQPVYGAGYASRVYGMVARPGVDLSEGAVRQTDRELDVAIAGEGWIAVQAADGEEAYTRAGDLRISPNGVLENGAGYAVMGDVGPIALPPAAKIEIAPDGTVSIQPSGGDPSNLAVVNRLKLVKPPLDQLYKGGDGLMRTHDGLPLPADAAVTLSVGALEGSNVNPVGAMVDLIERARQFEMQVKLLQIADANDRANTDLMSLA